MPTDTAPPNKSIESILARIKELQNQLQVEGRLALDSSFQEFFRKHPDVETLRWEQYTPYFNDGDPCVFGVNDLYVGIWAVNLTPEQAGIADDEDPYYGSDNETGEDVMLCYFDSYMGKYHQAVLGEDLTEAFQDANQIYEMLQKLEGVMEDIYGDNMRVTVSRDGVETEEYDHD